MFFERYDTTNLSEKHGISILPITSVEMNYKVSTARVSTGIARLDTMLDGGYYRRSTILISGTAGTGKTSLAASFAEAVCRSGQKCLYLAFEESEQQILRNMRTIGINLEPCVKRGLLKFHATRPSASGLEVHLVKMHTLIRDFTPDAIVMDPISNMLTIGNEGEVNSMLNRIIDHVKAKGITGLFTNLAHRGSSEEQTDIAISSLIDTWILLSAEEVSGERNRTLFILKSRGMAHSNQVREYHITSSGIRLSDVYVGEGQIFTGSARAAQEAKDRVEDFARQQEFEKRGKDFERKQTLLEAQIEALRFELEQERSQYGGLMRQKELLDEARAFDTRKRIEMRKADDKDPAPKAKKEKRGTK